MFSRQGNFLDRTFTLVKFKPTLVDPLYLFDVTTGHLSNLNYILVDPAPFCICLHLPVVLIICYVSYILGNQDHLVSLAHIAAEFV